MEQFVLDGRPTTNPSAVLLVLDPVSGGGRTWSRRRKPQLENGVGVGDGLPVPADGTGVLLEYCTWAANALSLTGVRPLRD